MRGVFGSWPVSAPLLRRGYVSRIAAVCAYFLSMKLFLYIALIAVCAAPHGAALFTVQKNCLRRLWKEPAGGRTYVKTSRVPL